MDSVLDKLKQEGWSLYDEAPIETGGDIIDKAALPYIVKTEAWDQFNNPVVYQTDMLLREFISIMGKDTYWKRHMMSRKYTYGMLFKILFGRDYDPKKDRKHTYVITKLFAYYSTRIQKEFYKDGKKKNRTAYTIMANVDDKPPYSLKLRLEWLAAKGEIPCWQNMQMPKDNLKAGHARNPKTEANMERRREEARKRYNEYQRRRKELIAEDGIQQTAGPDDRPVPDDDVPRENYRPSSLPERDCNEC